jgi:hypothetical protein
MCLDPSRQRNVVPEAPHYNLERRSSPRGPLGPQKNAGSIRSAHQIDDHDAAIRVIVFVACLAGGANWHRRDGELELRVATFLPRALSLFALPDLFDDERGQHV